jgi:hypothetical protein
LIQNFLTMLKSRLRRPDYFLPVHKWNEIT